MPILPTPPKVNVNLNAVVNSNAKPLAIKWIYLWVRGHKCPGKFLLLMVDDGDDVGHDRDVVGADTVESGDISILNSLIEHGIPRSLQLWGTIGRVITPKAFKVYIGSGETLLCENVCSHVSLLMQGVAVDVDLYVLPMQGPDVVLGIQWLQHLGKVTHDYARQTMEFNLLGTTFTLKGDESLRMKKISLHRMQALLEQDGVYGVYEIYHLPLEADGGDTSLLAASSQRPELDQLLGRFNDLFQVPNSLPPHRSINHRIHLLPDTKPVNSPFSSPVLLVKKKDGSYRFCVDYRALNAVTIKDKFPIPTADEMFDELGGATIFTKLDLRAGYHQIRVHESDVYKTAFRTHDGHYEFLVIINFAALLEHLECVLQRLQEHHFYVKRSKCVFGAETLEYLGHIISGRGVAMDPKKVVAVREWSEPTTQRQVRGFLGLAGYYRRFIKGYATLAAPLTDLLRKDGFKWGVQEATAFAELKHQLTTAPILSLPNFDQVFVVEADASATGIGAVLLQNNRPISFFSRKLGPRMCVAATYQKELFAIVEAVYKWRQYLEEFVTASFMAISQPVVGLLEKLNKENKTLEELVNLHHQIEKGSASAGFRREQGFLVFQNRYFVGKEDAQEDVSMDFITGLPTSKGLTVILVVVDRFSKYAHFGPLPTSFNGHKVAEVFLDMVVKLHGIPKTIVSDRDPIFLSKLWTELFGLSGT
ncbi:reverse transcriptase [Tanacetum coccineum]